MNLKERAEALYSQGMNLTEIGRQLGVSRQSVSYHLRHIERKSYRKKKLHHRICNKCGRRLPSDRWFNHKTCVADIGSDPWTENEHCVGI